MTSEQFLAALARLVPAERLLTKPGGLVPFESDGLTAFRARPRAVVLAESADEVIETVRLCHRAQVPFVARGSGTSLSGGAVPNADGIVIALNRLNRILEIDPVDRVAVVQPGVFNLDVSFAAEQYGLVLRARSVEPVGVHDRRQRRLQLGRRALLQVRDDAQSRARPARRAADRRGDHARRPQPRTRRLRPHGRVCRIGRALRHRARNHAEAAAAAGEVSHRAGRVPLAGSGRRRGLRGGRVGTAAGRDGDHGQPVDPGGRGRASTPAIRSTRRPSSSSSSKASRWKWRRRRSACRS